MEAATNVTHTLARLSGLAATVLGTLLMGAQVPTLLGGLVAPDQAPTLLGLYAITAVAVMSSLWALAFLAARTGVAWAFAGLAVLAGAAVPAIGLTADWRLYAIAGVGALIESEDLATRIRRARALRASRSEEAGAGRRVGT
jgi:hypothetical protein